jgi:very-short-patch-repair endonuclease
MRVFSNFKADELELDSGAKHGVRALKNLLKYAETRQLEVAKETGKATDSPFEDQVLEALRSRGYSVEPQVGTSGYFIDMAVRDPDLPGRYVLAIECDGAAYHSARSARDRDRLRQGVLEGLGWRFHRIWSTDWFRNQGQEIERTVHAIESARKHLATTPTLPEGVVPKKSEPLVLLRDEDEQGAGDESPSVPYVQAPVPNYAGRDLLQAAHSELNALLQTVIENEAPIHFSVVTKRVMQAYDLSRSGVRINARVMDALDRLLNTKGWTMRDEFIYTQAHMREPLKIEIRDRSRLATADKKLELVSPCEIQSAIFKAVEMSFSLPMDAVPGTVVQWLGFGRVTAKMQAVIEQELAVLEGGGILSTDAGGNFRVSEEKESV